MKVIVNVSLNDSYGSAKKIKFNIADEDVEGMTAYELEKYIEEEAADIASNSISWDWEIIE